MISKVDTSIIIPIYILPDKNWELWDFTLDCLASIREHTPEPHELILVDNGSPLSPPRLHYLMGKADIYVRNQTNLGFAPAVNQGLEVAGGDWLVVMNNDVRVMQGWLEAMCAAWGPRTGLISSHLHDHDPKHRAGREIAPVGHLFGALWMTQREIVDEIGLLDEQFEFGYYEDKDFAMRIEKAGYELVKAGWCHHAGNATSGKMPDLRKFFFENKLRYENKWNLSDGT